MRVRAVGAAIAISVCLPVAGPAQAEGGATEATTAGTTCTWGGTPAAPTGTFTLSPGLTNTPAPRPLAFEATGVLGGDPACHGTFRFTGQFDAGSTCPLISFEGIAKGLPSVRYFQGKDSVLGTGLPPTELFDQHHGLLGYESAQVLTVANAPSFTDCNSPAGLRGGTFSSVIYLFASPNDSK